MSGGRNPSSFNAGGNHIRQAGLGQWEKHTKGIGSKLLEKMGYKPGRGLGKHSEGIVEPVEIQANKGRSTLGLSSELNEAKRLKTPVANKYEFCDTGSSEESDEEVSNLPQFVSDDIEMEDVDEDSPENIFRRLEAAHKATVNDFIEQMRVEEAKRMLLEKDLSEHEKELRYHEELLSSYKQILDTMSCLETISKSDRLDMKSFWSSLSLLSLKPLTRCQFIQIFALPILRKTYNFMVTQSQPRRVDEFELERRLFGDMIDVAREWLKTRNNYNQLILWYLNWKDTLKCMMDLRRVKYFRRKLLDVMFLATTKGERDLNSFKYTSYKIDLDEKGCQNNTSEMHMPPRPSVNNYPTESTSINFKQLVEQAASDRNLNFSPVFGRHHESKQVYKLEKLSVYIDNKVIFVRTADNWLPKTLSDTINMVTKDFRQH